jgi:hypothetical protein
VFNVRVCECLCVLEGGGGRQETGSYALLYISSAIKNVTKGSITKE